MEIVNRYGRRYVVKLHFREGDEPIVAFHPDGWAMDKPGLYAYCVSTFLEIK